MSYLVGLGFGPQLPRFNPPDLTRPPPTPAEVAAGLTPTALLWMAPRTVQEAAARTIGPTAAGAAISAETTQYVQNIVAAQDMLIQLGVYPGPISGAMDAATQVALDTFRGQVGLPKGGPVTQNDLSALSMSLQMMKAQGQQPMSTQQPMPPGYNPGGYNPPGQYTGYDPSKTTMGGGLPAWALPVGAAIGGLILLKVLKVF